MYKSSGNVFKDIGFSDAEALSLLIRSSMMVEIEKTIRKNKWTQVKAAELLGITQPRVSEIMSDRVDLFTIDTLVRYLIILGKKVSFSVKNSDAA